MFASHGQPIGIAVLQTHVWTDHLHAHFALEDVLPPPTVEAAQVREYIYAYLLCSCWMFAVVFEMEIPKSMACLQLFTGNCENMIIRFYTATTKMGHIVWVARITGDVLLQ